MNEEEALQNRIYDGEKSGLLGSIRMSLQKSQANTLAFFMQ